MGDYKYNGSVSNSVGPVSPSEFGNNSKSSIFCTTPSVTDPVVSAMQDDLLINKNAVKNQQSISPSIELNGEKNLKSKDEEGTNKINSVGLNGKQNEQLQSLSTVSTPLHIQQAYGPDPNIGAVNTGSVWPAGLDDAMMHGMPPHGVAVNGSIAYQNFQTNNPYSQMPGLVQGQSQSAQQRRAITAQHNFPGNVGRSMPGGPNMYMNKGYPPAWAGQQGTWSPGPGMAQWSRGRSVPNINPVPNLGGYGNLTRKPPPTYNQPMVVQSPIKFRRSTSFPGKSIFPQQPTFEITNMEDGRDMMMYQVYHFLSRLLNIMHSY